MPVVLSVPFYMDNETIDWKRIDRENMIQMNCFSKPMIARFLSQTLWAKMSPILLSIRLFFDPFIE